MKETLVGRYGCRMLILTGVVCALLGVCITAVDYSHASNRKNKHEPLISGEAQTGTYETVDIVLEYQYNYQPGATGKTQMDFNASLRRKGKLDTLNIWINFFDDNGKRLGRAFVFSSGAYKGVANRSFEVQLKVPPGSSRFNFTSMSRQKRERL